MKGLFRRPSDTSSSSVPSAGPLEGNVELSAASQGPGEPSPLPQTGLDSSQPDTPAVGTGAQVFDPLALDSPLHPAIPSLPRNHHFTLLISSLLESYISSRIPGNTALAENVYTELAQQLPVLGIAPENSQHFSRPELASVRQGYLDGIDGLLKQAVEKNNGESSEAYPPANLAGDGRVSVIERDSARPTLRRMVTDIPVSGSKNLDEGKAIHRSSSLSLLMNAAKPAKFRPSTAPALAESPSSFFPEAPPTAPIPSKISIFLPPRHSRYDSDFKEVGFLGKGGFGSVYHVINRLDNAEYAVKKVIFKNEMFQKIQDGRVEGFNRILSEVKTMAKLEHGNIVRYYGGWIEGTLGEKFIAPVVPVVPVIPAGVDVGLGVLPTTFLQNDFDKEKLAEATVLEDISDGGVIFAYSEGEEGSRVQTLENSATGSKCMAQDTQISEESAAITEGEEEYFDDSVEMIPRSYPPGVKLASSRLKSRPLSNDYKTKTPKVVFNLSAPSSDNSSGPLGSSLFSGGNGALVKSAPRQNEKGHKRSSSGPIVTLHIQMSLHPLVLTLYITPADPPLPPPEEKHCFCLEKALKLFLGLVEGIDYLHQKGIAHRDLKPGNVFLDILPGKKMCRCPENSVMVVPRIGDFGLVKPIHEVADTTGEHGSAIVGTELYRPPLEMVNRYDVVGRDLFALGVMLVELVFEFGTRMERGNVVTALAEQGQLPDGFDGRVAEIVRGCCGVGQYQGCSWSLERAKKAATCILMVEVGE